ncbi:hypothetical protein [Sphingomonas edaphi]|uniref:Spore coat protein U domain-containing protein n=1 Tax=Sphingomonas edaphi TaxID=2315689 RepID=A0A418PYF9_9SPHN|nr:hypothetical protein [Sphingomonas edaphi]RIX27029.1 hypothetical protein D3M59_10765 [Sphingomonas edaphi]
MSVSRAVLAAIALTLSATAAHSATIPDNLASSLRYRVTGTIPTSCSLSQPVSAVEVIGLQNSATDTVNATQTDLPFTISCTTAVQVSMSSLNGGLQTDRTTSDADFASRVEYRATLDLPGNSSVLECRSNVMNAGGCRRTLVNEALEGNGRIRLNTQTSDDLLLAGTYADTVTLTISPRLDGGNASAVTQ